MKSKENPNEKNSYKIGKTVDKSTKLRYNVVTKKQRCKRSQRHAIRSFTEHLLGKRILQHRTMSQMLRELSRNSQLRKVCGLQNDEIPSKYVMTRFMKKLRRHRNLIKEIFYTQRNELAEIKKDFGNNTGVDGKYLDSYAKKENKNKEEDGRRDTDAKYGIKEKYYKDKKENAKILERTDTATADKGYDDKKVLEKLEKKNILPIIDKRKMIKEEKEIKRTVYYDDNSFSECKTR